jgi:hypothetical protein
MKALAKVLSPISIPRQACDDVDKGVVGRRHEIIAADGRQHAGAHPAREVSADPRHDRAPYRERIRSRRVGIVWQRVHDQICEPKPRQMSWQWPLRREDDAAWLDAGGSGGTSNIVGRNWQAGQQPKD